MSPLQTLREELADERARAAILVGLASIPFTIALSWDSPSETIAGTPVLVAGLLAGYIYADRSMESRRAGKLVGLVGCVPFVTWAVIDLVSFAVSSSQYTMAIVVVLGPIAVLFGAAVYALFGMVGAAIGKWIAGRVSLDPRDLAERDGRGSRWWRCVAAYVLAAPVLLALALGIGVEIDGDAGFLGGFLAVLSLLVLSAVTFVALFNDATALRDVERTWEPNVWLYAGVPVGVAPLVYLAATVGGSVNPGGDSWYGFVVALWVVSAVYLGVRRRRVGTP